MNPFVGTSANSVFPVNKSNPKTTVFVASGKRDLKMVTKTIEVGNRVVIKRNIFWYDSIKKINRKKVELQVYECCDDEVVDNNLELVEQKDRLCELIMEFEKIT